MDEPKRGADDADDRVLRAQAQTAEQKRVIAHAIEEAERLRRDAHATVVGAEKVIDALRRANELIGA